MPAPRYDKVIDIPNSMTVLPELLPLSIEMARRKLTGIMNFTNPGAISHNEILGVRPACWQPRAAADACLSAVAHSGVRCQCVCL